MAAPGKKSADSADEWLIDPDDPPAQTSTSRPEEFAPDERELGELGGESIGAETAQWIVPGSGANGLATEETRPVRRAPAKRASSKKQARRASKALEKLREENADLSERVRELEDAVEEHEEREDELRDRIKQLEAELADTKKKARAAKPASPSRRRTTASRTATGSRRAKSGERAKPAARSGRAKRDGEKNGMLDLNGATFEELRNLGLSVTQSARMIAYRDVRGGFDSLDELDDIPGLSADTRRDLKGRLQLGA